VIIIATARNSDIKCTLNHGLRWYKWVLNKPLPYQTWFNVFIYSTVVDRNKMKSQFNSVALHGL